MKYRLQKSDRVGFLRPANDAHSLGIASVSALLEEAGIWTGIAGSEVCRAVEAPDLATNAAEIRLWIKHVGLSVLGFSYRLDGQDGLKFFTGLYRFLKTQDLLAGNGGPIRALYFAGLPGTCDLIQREFPDLAGLFRGDETMAETLQILGLPDNLVPAGFETGMLYDETRLGFGRDLINKGDYLFVKAPVRDYPGYGGSHDSLLARVDDGIKRAKPPLTRVHVGPYSGDQREDFRLFLAWARELANHGLLDVLSIGTSQLTQSHFFRDRTGLADGGGISLANQKQFAEIWEAARPMLVRTYAGSRDIPRLAKLYEESLNMAWHTLSFWWFCQIDGRGPHTVRENLEEHFATLRYLASINKPFEPNVPHHFAFRGSDDLSYVVSGFLAAKAAQRCGIRTLVLQIMLNTPKSLWGIQDLAKAQTLTALVRELEGPDFRVLLQPRGGLDYFSRDLEKAKIQLAAVTAMMDDIEPENPQSPQIIHVVSYSEAVQLADPGIIHESIQITQGALQEYRSLKASRAIPDIAASPDLHRRRSQLLAEARAVIATIEDLIPDPYSPPGFYEILAAGFLPVPDLWECREEFSQATAWQTRNFGGSIRVVGPNGQALPAQERMAQIRSAWKGQKHD